MAGNTTNKQILDKLVKLKESLKDVSSLAKIKTTREALAEIEKDPIAQAALQSKFSWAPFGDSGKIVSQINDIKKELNDLEELINSQSPSTHSSLHILPEAPPAAQTKNDPPKNRNLTNLQILTNYTAPFKDTSSQTKQNPDLTRLVDAAKSNIQARVASLEARKTPLLNKDEQEDISRGKLLIGEANLASKYYLLEETITKPIPTYTYGKDALKANLEKQKVALLDERKNFTDSGHQLSVNIDNKITGLIAKADAVISSLGGAKKSVTTEPSVSNPTPLSSSSSSSTNVTLYEQAYVSQIDALCTKANSNVLANKNTTLDDVKKCLQETTQLLERLPESFKNTFNHPTTALQTAQAELQARVKELTLSSSSSVAKPVNFSSSRNSPSPTRQESAKPVQQVNLSRPAAQNLPQTSLPIKPSSSQGLTVEATQGPSRQPNPKTSSRSEEDDSDSFTNTHTDNSEYLTQLLNIGMDLNALDTLGDSNTDKMKRWIDTYSAVSPTEENEKLHKRLQTIQADLTTKIEEYQHSHPTHSFSDKKGLDLHKLRLEHSLNEEGMHQIKVVAATDETIEDNKVQVPLSKELTINYTHAIKPTEAARVHCNTQEKLDDKQKIRLISCMMSQLFFDATIKQPAKMPNSIKDEALFTKEVPLVLRCNQEDAAKIAFLIARDKGVPIDAIQITLVDKPDNSKTRTVSTEELRQWQQPSEKHNTLKTGIGNDSSLCSSIIPDELTELLKPINKQINNAINTPILATDPLLASSAMNTQTHVDLPTSEPSHSFSKGR